jgi:Domain of unknown function (DUF4390)
MRPSGRRHLLKLTTLVVAGWIVGAAPASSQAQTQATSRPGMDLQHLQVQRTDDALTLSYQVRVDLPKDVEDALMRGVSVVFVARANLYRSRWYWTDKPRVELERRWRLSYQPLTRLWRVSFDGLSQNYHSLREALGVMQKASQWRILEPAPAPDDREHYLEFSFELDREELPRPMQIGLSGQNDWNLSVFKRLPVSLLK